MVKAHLVTRHAHTHTYIHTQNWEKKGNKSKQGGMTKFTSGNVKFKIKDFK